MTLLTASDTIKQVEAKLRVSERVTFGVAAPILAGSEPTGTSPAFESKLTLREDLANQRDTAEGEARVQLKIRLKEVDEDIKASKLRFESQLQAWTRNNKAVVDYNKLCIEITTIIAEYKDVKLLFSAEKPKLGLDIESTLQIHELIAQLRVQKQIQAKLSPFEVHSIVDNALRKHDILNKGMHQALPEHFMQLYTALNDCRTRLVDADTLLSSEVADNMSLRKIRMFMISFLDQGADCQHVHDLVEALTEPNNSNIGLLAWINQAHALVVAEAKKSSIIILVKSPLPKSTNSVATKGQGKKSVTDTPKAPAMTPEEFNKIWPKDYCLPAKSSPFDCPYPHNGYEVVGYTPTHYGHNCNMTKTIVKQAGYINTSVNAAVLAALQG